MLNIADYGQSFKADQEKERRKVAVYGAGQALHEEIYYMPEIDYICDKNKDEFQGRKVIRPADLEDIREPFRILFVVRNQNGKVFAEACSELGKLDIVATIYNYYDNISFDIFNKKNKVYIAAEAKEKMKVNLVCKDTGWILRKFAERLHENLKMLGADAEITGNVDPEADINHHVQFGMCMPLRQDTLMVSHVDCGYWLEALQIQMREARLAVCMSRETMLKLAGLGIPRQKLCYVTPAHDGVIKPKKYAVGITHRNHGDFRKRNHALAEIFRELNPDYFLIKIMGDGWESIVAELRGLGYEVEYHSLFDYQEYQKLMPSLDYYMFFGTDEGSMGLLDALAAGIGTIATPQGFYLDIQGGITYPCMTVNEFSNALLELQGKRERIVKSVEHLTWENYAKKHLEIWEYLLRRKELEELYRNQHIYEDGIFSMFPDNLGYF